MTHHFMHEINSK
jgi:hypothetical protein